MEKTMKLQQLLKLIIEFREQQISLPPLPQFTVPVRYFILKLFFIRIFILFISFYFFIYFNSINLFVYLFIYL